MLKTLLALFLFSSFLFANIPGIAPRSIITPWNSEAQQAYAGAMKDYDGAYSYDPDGGNITAYHWYVDDVEVGRGSTLSHVFTLEKTETSRIVYLKLKVQDDEGTTGEYGFEVAVLCKPQNNYYIKDHLGNIRVTVDEDGNVVGSQDYYPFGLQMAGRSGNNTYTSDVYK